MRHQWNEQRVGHAVTRRGQSDPPREGCPATSCHLFFAEGRIAAVMSTVVDTRLGTNKRPPTSSYVQEFASEMEFGHFPPGKKVTAEVHDDDKKMVGHHRLCHHQSLLPRMRLTVIGNGGATPRSAIMRTLWSVYVCEKTVGVVLGGRVSTGHRLQGITMMDARMDDEDDADG
ncbi:unnamed protein product [Lampetra fluviatilis]